MILPCITWGVGKFSPHNGGVGWFLGLKTGESGLLPKKLWWCVVWRGESRAVTPERDFCIKASSREDAEGFLLWSWGRRQILQEARGFPLAPYFGLRNLVTYFILHTVSTPVQPQHKIWKLWLSEQLKRMFVFRSWWGVCECVGKLPFPDGNARRPLCRKGAGCVLPCFLWRIPVLAHTSKFLLGFFKLRPAKAAIICPQHLVLRT